MRCIIGKHVVSFVSYTLLIGLVIYVIAPVSLLAEAPVRFIVTGDSRGADNGVNQTILSEIAQAIIDEDVAFVLFNGDLVTGYTDSATLVSQLMTWRDIMQPVYDAGIGVYPCRGNHDVGYKGAWDQVFAGVYSLPGNGPSGEENVTFSFTYANIFVVGLDQYVTPHRINQSWLDEQFSSNSQPNVFVFGHEPAFSVRHTDCLDDYPANRNTFWNSIAEEGGRVYFCGHDHFYDHCRIDDGDGDPTNDIYQYLVGSAGAPVYTWDGMYDGNNGPWTPVNLHHEMEYGYVVVVVDSLHVSYEWKHRTAPGVYETFDYGCGDCNSSGDVDFEDVMYMLNYIFSTGSSPEPIESGDADMSGSVDIDDVVYLINYIFSGGPAPCS